MMSPKQRYQQLEQNILAWAQADNYIRAAVVVGSRARTKHPADDWSDLDLMFLTTAQASFFEETAWLIQLGGEVWAKEQSVTRAGDREWLVLFADGIKADFFFVEADYTLSDMLQESRFERVFGRGVYVLLDKTASNTTAVLPRPMLPHIRPTAAEFEAVVHKAFLHATRTAKMLRRGEIWQAWLLSQRELKWVLFEMITWHTWANKGLDYDTWHNGRLMEAWSDPYTMQAFSNTFANYDGEALWDGLLASMALFEQLGRETAVLWRLSYPSQRSQKIWHWLQQTRGVR